MIDEAQQTVYSVKILVLQNVSVMCDIGKQDASNVAPAAHLQHTKTILCGILCEENVVDLTKNTTQRRSMLYVYVAHSSHSGFQCATVKNIFKIRQTTITQTP